MTPAQRVVSDLASLRFDRLGHPVIRWDVVPPVVAAKDRPHQLLVLLVEFSDVSFERYRGDAGQGDKLAAYYQEQLFDDAYARKDTLSHYYATQSSGAFHVTGKVLPPVKLSRERAAYGSSVRPAGGTWRNDADPDGMVEEALSLAVARYGQLPWRDFDQWDPADYDQDGKVEEPDGYIDHFVLVFAGGGQSSCQLLNKIDEVLTPNVGMEALAKLDKRQRECSDRLWPHRDALRRREGSGPTVDGHANPRGGKELMDSLWAYDYNMQSEYTEASTFIHEFGHSIGLPDVYSRTSSNSTGPWEVMSSTSDPSPQDLSAWSRLQLGWLKPRVIVPPAFGGQASAALDLGLALDSSSRADDAVMVVLPPKERTIELTTLPPALGTQALYSGQGNEMNRTAELALDLGAAKSAQLSLAAWWEIEGGWDFAYVEASKDGGQSWERLLPTDPRHMPAKHGHDGKDTRPGFTGLSGDFDGDGKNESNPACDPSVDLKHGEDQAGEAKSPCLEPTWVGVTFDLEDYLGIADLRFRIRYYTDAAAVMRGILIDNVYVDAGAGPRLAGDFESALPGSWRVNGFSASSGRHDLLVPHYYLLEFRDPYAGVGYDTALAEPGYSFYYDANAKKMIAIATRPRPGTLLWYADGAFAWSENDPAINGPGKGYLLAVDANPNEIQLPGWEGFLKGSADAFDTHYDVSGADAQKLLSKAFLETVCFVRGLDFLPRGELPIKGGKCPGRRRGAPAPLAAIDIDGKKAMYSYEVVGRFLPGDRAGYEKVGELIDVKNTKKGPEYRLRDRSLRYLHTLDAPFAATEFARARVVYDLDKGALVERESAAAPASPRYDDSQPTRWLNAQLPFGGAAVPSYGFSFQVAEPTAAAPAGTRTRVTYEWKN